MSIEGGNNPNKAIAGLLLMAAGLGIELHQVSKNGLKETITPLAIAGVMNVGIGLISRKNVIAGCIVLAAGLMWGVEYAQNHGLGDTIVPVIAIVTFNTGKEWIAREWRRGGSPQSGKN